MQKQRFPMRLQVSKDYNEADGREDVEQTEKSQEIIDLLVAAGYFRARIKNLSSFDRVVGGMTWCIESCNVEVDVDLLFQENLTIGQKITLTEKIVAVLLQMKCPHPIEPHQIQGLDFIHVFPVIQWLVKRSMEFREDVSNACYSFALNQFDKYFPQDHGLTDKQLQLLKHITLVNEVYKPHRVSKRKNSVPFKDINSKIQITLFEYGRSGTARTAKNDNVGDIGELRLEEISNSRYNEKIQVAILKERNEDLIKILNKSFLQRSALKGNIYEIRELIAKMLLEQKDYIEVIQSSEPDENNVEKIEEVERWLLHGNILEKLGTEFEEHCRNELSPWKDSIENAGEKSAVLDAEIDEFNDRLEQENERLKDLRLQMAKKNRAISILLRHIDKVPCRAELAQYQKRFIELYNQISAKHKETKQYYSLFNTLEDMRQYLKKELSLLNSVIDNYPEAMGSKEGKEEFLQQLLNILDGLKQSTLKLERRLSQQKRERHELGDSSHTFIEMNRKYVSTIKMLKAEFEKNEEFMNKYHIYVPEEV